MNRSPTHRGLTRFELVRRPPGRAPSNPNSPPRCCGSTPAIGCTFKPTAPSAASLRCRPALSWSHLSRHARHRSRRPRPATSRHRPPAPPAGLNPPGAEPGVCAIKRPVLSTTRNRYFHAHIDSIDPPGRRTVALIPANPLLDLWRIALDPWEDGDVVHRDAALLHHLGHVAVADAVFAILAHTREENHLVRKPTALKHGHWAGLLTLSIEQAHHLN